MSGKIVGSVRGQVLHLIYPPLVEGTVDYLTAEFSFSGDWDGLSKWAHFKQGSTIYDVPLTNDAITEDQHLNLSAGTWDVYLHGSGDNRRITTTTVRMKVLPYLDEDGEPLPEVPLTFAEVLDQRAQRIQAVAYAVEAGESARKEAEAIREQNEEARVEAEKNRKDGITPHIGDNGNWYLGDTDTGKPSRGETGAGMDITGATVDQIAKITAVDGTGKPTAWEAVDMPSGGGSAAAYVLTMSTDEADAQVNSDAVTSAIAEHGHVVLKPGKYPVKPGIVIESGKLDMNGAHFYTVDYKSSTPLVYMKGEAPEICNGELEGSYDLADDEEGYEFFEKESLIFPYGVNDAYIHHMELHNNWGYCISTGTETEKTTHYVGTATQIRPNNDIDFQTDAIEIPEGYKYVTASGQIGYNRIISTANVYYRFFDEGGTEIRVSNAVPKARIAIPNGAKTVKITTSLDDETFLAYNVYFTNYRESLTVSDCKFRNFHSLGMAGFEGPTNIVGCSFIESGKPRSEATPTGRATTGGVDIEDTPCPEFYMANCYSRDCAKLLMFGGYKGVVTNCIGDNIGAYRGWQLDISDCNISKLYTMGSYIRLTVNGVHADGVDIKEENWKDVHGNISTNTTSPGLQCFDSFLVKMTDSSNGGGEVCGVVNGRIKCSSGVGLRLSHGFSTDKGSRLVIDSTTLFDPDVNGILKATGDIYGLESNTAVVPCGYTIHDSTFTIDELKSVWMSEVEISGAFDNCVLNMPGAPYFKNQRNANGSCSNPIDLTFTDCVINNADNYLFSFVPHAGGTVTFKNCTIADESKLFNGDASSMTVKILSGGGHWETVLDTVWEQDVIHPTAFDSETGIFTCAEGELANLALDTEYVFFQQCAKEGVAYNTILDNENLKVTKLSDTTFSIDVTPPTTFVPTNVKFIKGACLAITDIDTRKIRLTLDGQFKPTATLYDKPFCGMNVPYSGRNTGYQQIRNAYQAYQQVTAEVESPYRIVGEILCGFNAPSKNASFHFKNNSFCCPLVPSEFSEGASEFSSDGTKIAKLYSTSAPHLIGTAYENTAIGNDYLRIISGTKVKLERWVE